MFRRNGQVKSPWSQSWGEKSPWWDVLIFATGRIAFKPGVRVELWMRRLVNQENVAGHC